MSLFRVTLKRAAPLGLVALSAHNNSNAAQAAGDDKGSNLPDLPDLGKITESIKNFDISSVNFDTAIPIASTTSFGCLSGYACGTVVKQGFRLMTGLFGGLFILSQIAHHKGYVSVNMDKVEADVMSFLDTNMDGKLDQSDLQDWAKNAVDVLVTDTKLSAGSFGAGFLMGLRR